DRDRPDRERPVLHRGSRNLSAVKRRRRKEGITTGRTRGFAWWLGAITLFALVLRIAYVIWFERTHPGPAGDAFYYHYQANALARAEALMLVVLLVIPLLLFYGKNAAQRRERILRAALACVVALLTCVPIVVHNFARFNQPTYLSTGLGSVLAVANCSWTVK